MAMVKGRWEEMVNGEEDGKEKSEEERMRERTEEAKNRMIWNRENKTVDATYVLATGMHQNRRTTLPRPGDSKKEALNDARKSIWRKVFKEYKKEKCNEKGNI